MSPLFRLLAVATSLAFCLLSRAAAPLPPAWSNWQESRTLSVPSKPGELVRIELPPSVLGRLQADFSDLRLLSGNDRELPWAIDLPVASKPLVHSVGAARLLLRDGATYYEFDNACPNPAGVLTGLEIRFIRTPSVASLQVQSSLDGSTWETLLDRVPLKASSTGLSQQAFALPPCSAPKLRLVFRERPPDAVSIDSVSLSYSLPDAYPVVSTALAPSAVDEAFGETRLEFRLPSSGLYVSALSFEVQDPAFRRLVRLVQKTVTEAGISERVVASAILSREPGRQISASLLLPVNARLTSETVTLVVENGDSPPLSFQSFALSRRPVYLVYPNPGDGVVRLLSASRGARPPAYDLASMISSFRSLSPSEAAWGLTEPNPSFVQTDGVPDIPLLGSTLDPKLWSVSRSLVLKSAGVQRLELDSLVLAGASASLADLRLVRGDRQVPFLIDRTSYSRRLDSLRWEAVPAESPGNKSRWKITLPAAGLPVRLLSCTASDAYFERSVRLYEKLTNARGESYDRPLASALWSRKGQGTPARLVFDSLSAPRGDTLFLEVDNGDNQPLTLRSLEVAFPVVHLYFKTADAAPLSLLYANPQVLAPAYDLRLVSSLLLGSSFSKAEFDGPPEDSRSTSSQGLRFFLNSYAQIVFCISLGIVVLILLWVLAKFLPKQPSPKN